ncbi:Regulator of chromosome condensation (RCC1) repeat [Carpediemonas membranifera]|uniref:Regulator of chromosome condensation (RCC1) repeat n=1 Tax=Carpediemonas membranifera TaxID=201153 RepID=A0A8J6BC77_9EUKA|nr:Regulator of chromosome condensation (RCC1) repeat [Carpediemonas membranifera]|eukprot:KAG9397202.1 Regulator of chromosome condensation (RCC1) repeat [Carpediemonas membranifera]
MKIDVTINTPLADGEELPDTIFTLMPGTIVAILHHAEVPSVQFICKKFYHCAMEEDKASEDYDFEATRLRLYHGRLYTSGNNLAGQCGAEPDTPWLCDFHWVRLPPVLDLASAGNATFAYTSQGIFAWGSNTHGRLGIGSHHVSDTCSAPRRVQLDGIRLVRPYERVTLFFTQTAIFAAGWNKFGTAGVGSTKHHIIATPERVSVSGWVDEVWSFDRVTFFRTRKGLFACGHNLNGALALGADEMPGLVDRVIPSPVLVPLPPDIRVTDVRHSGHSTFFLSGRRCFVAGANEFGQLGCEHSVELPLTELELPVDDLISACGSTVLRSGCQLFACGSNIFSRFPLPGATLETPTPLSLPWPVQAVALGNAFFAQREDGAWFTRGRNNHAKLGVVSTEAEIDWNQIAVDSVDEIYSGHDATLFVTHDGIKAAGWVGLRVGEPHPCDVVDPRTVMTQGPVPARAQPMAL